MARDRRRRLMMYRTRDRRRRLMMYRQIHHQTSTTVTRHDLFRVVIIIIYLSLKAMYIYMK